MRPLLLVLVLSGCVTARVTERFTIDASATELRASTEEAAQKLGWTIEPVDAGSFRLTGYPRLHWLVKKPLLRPKRPLLLSRLLLRRNRSAWPL